MAVEDEDGLPISPHEDRGAHLLNELDKALKGIKLAEKLAKEALRAAKDYLEEENDDDDDDDD